MFAAASSFLGVVVYLLLIAFVAGIVIALLVSLPRAAHRGRRSALLVMFLFLGAVLLVPDDGRAIAARSALPVGIASALFAGFFRGLRPGAGGAGRKAFALFLGAAA